MGYARGADEMGVDIIQNCEVKGIRRNEDSVEGIETSKDYQNKKIDCCSRSFKCCSEYGWFKITFGK